MAWEVRDREDPIKPLLTYKQFLKDQKIFPENELDFIKNDFYKLPWNSDEPGWVYVYFSNIDKEKREKGEKMLFKIGRTKNPPERRIWDSAIWNSE